MHNMDMNINTRKKKKSSNLIQATLLIKNVNAELEKLIRTVV